MRTNEIAKHIRRQPFSPFRLDLSDGSYYDIRRPEMIAVSLREVIVGLKPFQDHIPDQFAFCDPVHVVRIEPLNGSRRSSKTRHNPRS